MKKLVLYAVVLCLSVGVITGCVAKDSAVENETEIATLASENMSDEYIIEKFYEAYDFWGDWIYGQNYRAYDDLSELSFGSSRESVTSESPIQTAVQLRAEMEKHFTKEMADMYWKQLVPEDKDGKLYIYCGDMGNNGPWEDVMSVTVKKMNSSKYSLKIDMELFDGEGYTVDAFNKYVYYVLEDGKWVFENDVENEFFYSWGVPEKYNSEEFAPYNEILKTYYAALWQKWDDERIDKYGLVDIMSAFYENEPLKSVGYCLMDINADGQNELLIGKVNANDKIVWDMYSVKDREAYRLLVSGERNRHYICESDEGYIIANEIHTNTMNFSYSYYRDLDESILKERLWLDWGEWYHSADYLNVTSQVVDEERVNEIAENYQAKYITPKFIPFETLG